ncbi:ubiquitin carboxyl-terminal hydrolase isozyme L5, putative [Eimeria tenella]|uniref:ubiquitinyl hydrolase 1 n=1 Tax=Eimeria tenella TaxID=5802 RepID=U6KQ00_EIMTE|nr:ubiquitin carboxyl-terminal hydrolase isozyme L5, putative [Eimeria tenella]CDJ37523.1 ubiquitin carboxyl-terminal hydrolase isozyme L5, putative [Eimeria tenella]|eukprot:XP_013228361.1 ubiquitin carboxyl-terminal hydrolase isozyme L5, putative [Eimeria tenella]
MAADYSGWCLIESDPGVFSELVEMLGVRGVAFAEVYGLDKEAFDALEAEGSHRKVLGFIFLFNWGKDKKRQRSSSSSSSSQGGAAANPQVPQDLFFAAQGPLCVGEINGENWIEVARREIQRRVEEIQSQGEELRFNLMALTTNPLDEIEEELKRLQEAAAAAAEQLQAGTAADSKELQQEWQRENARRRHDFTPFILCALRHLARKGELVKAVRRATAAAAAAEAAAAAKTV